MITIAADPKHLGARIGITSVLHTWGSAMTHHPHVHMIVAGGGLSEDGARWIACRPNFLLAVRVLSRLFRRLVLQMLIVMHILPKGSERLPARDFVPWRFSDACRGSAWMVLSSRRPRNLHMADGFKLYAFISS